MYIVVSLLLIPLGSPPGGFTVPCHLIPSFPGFSLANLFAWLFSARGRPYPGYLISVVALSLLFWFFAGVFWGRSRKLSAPWTVDRTILVAAAGGILALYGVWSAFDPSRKGPRRAIEMKSYLAAIRSMQVAHFAEWNVYVGDQPLTPVADRRGRPERVPWRDDTRFSILGFAPEWDVSCSYALEGPAWPTDGFTARAECDLDGDGKAITYWTTEDSEVLATSPGEGRPPPQAPPPPTRVESLPPKTADALPTAAAPLPRQPFPPAARTPKIAVPPPLPSPPLSQKPPKPRTTKALIEALKNPDPGQRREAAEMLGARKIRTAAASLLPLARDPNTGVRIQAVRSLGQIGDERAVLTLIALMREDVEEPLRDEAARALTRITGQSFPGYYEWGTWWFKSRDDLTEKSVRKE